jgi:hypothetical protein
VGPARCRATLALISQPLRPAEEEEEEEFIQNREEEEEFITSGNWRGKHNLLSRGAGAEESYLINLTRKVPTRCRCRVAPTQASALEWERSSSPREDGGGGRGGVFYLSKALKDAAHAIFECRITTHNLVCAVRLQSMTLYLSTSDAPWEEPDAGRASPKSNGLKGTTSQPRRTAQFSRQDDRPPEGKRRKVV